jgi:hypothetical protein
MRYLLLVILALLISNQAYAQYGNPENQSLTNSMNGFFSYATSSQQAAGFGQAAVNRSIGAATKDFSESAINYETAYGMRLQNNLARVNTYFEMRQSNHYYKALEQVQKAELRRLKASGELNIESLNYLYNRGPGLMTPYP